MLEGQYVSFARSSLTSLVLDFGPLLVKLTMAEEKQHGRRFEPDGFRSRRSKCCRVFTSKCQIRFSNHDLAWERSVTNIFTIGTFFGEVC